MTLDTPPERGFLQFNNLKYRKQLSVHDLDFQLSISEVVIARSLHCQVFDIFWPWPEFYSNSVGWGKAGGESRCQGVILEVYLDVLVPPFTLGDVYCCFVYVAEVWEC